MTNKSLFALKTSKGTILGLDGDWSNEQFFGPNQLAPRTWSTAAGAARFAQRTGRRDVKVIDIRKAA